MSRLRRAGSRNRGRNFGLSGECQRKIEAKYSKELELECRAWLEKIVGTIDWPPERDDAKPWDCFADAISDGVILCRSMNTIKGCADIKINTGTPGKAANPFKIRENIENFLCCCMDEPFCCKPGDLFQVHDLYEKDNMASVLFGIQAFCRKAHNWNKEVPLFGPKEAEKNPRNHEQLHNGVLCYWN